MPTATVWTVLYCIWVASEALILIITRTRRNGGNVQDRGSLFVLWFVIGASITAGFWFAATHPVSRSHYTPAFALTSVLMLVAGLAVRWTAIVTLGRSFSANVAIHATQTLHTQGLFRFVRHPSYSGLFLIFLALGLHPANWFGLAIVFIPCSAALLYRIHVEEAVLQQAFGRQYTQYSARTHRLIPGIY